MSNTIAHSPNDAQNDQVRATSRPVFGCTCGECTDEWLSPRMRYRLLGMNLIITGLVYITACLCFFYRPG